MDLYFSIFQEPNDLYDRQKYIRYIEGQVELPPDFKRQWIDAHQYMMKAVGRDFLMRAGDGHPLFRLLTGTAPW
ncbi:hypothetical protein [Puia dinghuensis]|uniref:hypothetical protein n=1 Tax=Puia dinghuensis TaxID=1792502 RepID=UPI0016651F16|nr:hypothetical protein [Puia dinghuensis]